MDPLLIALSLLSYGCLLWTVLQYAKYRRSRTRLLQHLERLNCGQEGKSLVRLDWKKTVWQWAESLGPIGEHFLFPHSFEELERELGRSGFSQEITTKKFLGLKVLVSIFGFALGGFGLVSGLPLSHFGLVLLPLAGFFFPVIWLRRRVAHRQKELSEEIPDFLDIMSVALQAGASLEQAIRVVGELTTGPLQEEIMRLYREMDLGVERETAWGRMEERNSSPELHKLVSGLLQGFRFGVPVAEVFRLQAEEMRRMRIELVKQQAAKASPKITVITTMLMAPSVFLMILGLLALNVFYNADGLGIEELFK